MKKQNTSDERDILSCPGDTIIETLACLEIGPIQLVQQLGLPAKQVAGLIVGTEALTDEIAYKLEKVLGIDRDFWIARERIYREKLAEIEKRENNADIIH